MTKKSTKFYRLRMVKNNAWGPVYLVEWRWDCQTLWKAYSGGPYDWESAWRKLEKHATIAALQVNFVGTF